MYRESQNNIIPIADVGGGSDTLQCVTDRTPCCDGGQGQWFFPNGTRVTNEESRTFHQTRNSNGAVNLIRSGDVTSPTGSFCCMVPDAINIGKTVCAKLGKDIPFRVIANLVLHLSILSSSHFSSNQH